MTDTATAAPPAEADDVLVFPPERTFDPPKGCEAYDDGPLEIRYVNKGNLDWGSLAFNLVSITIILIVPLLLIRFKTHNPLILIAFSATVIWVLGVFFLARLGTNVDGMQYQIWLDYIFSDRLIAYSQGFHFTTWSSKDQGNMIDYQKKEIIDANRKDGTAFTFATQDGLDVMADVTIVYNRRPGLEALSWSLKFKSTDEITTLIKAVVQGRLSDLGGCNSYETLLRHKAEVAAWVANFFAGETQTSPFEKKTGTRVLDPVAKDFDLTPESKEIFRAKARIGIFKRAIQSLTEKEVGLSPEEANLAVQAAQGSLKRVVHTYQGIPPGAKVVALGSEGIAIAAKGK